MLRQLKMTCFRRHVEKEVVFGPGLTAIKGANEAGKSTVIEAVLYALYGSDALRDSLSEVVTWGRKESDLKVSLTIEIGGHLYNFTRGKSGAECEHEGGLVTGQKEVSAFAAELLGAPLKAASHLMLANQNSLRGALEEGPKAVAQQIERLADFDLFERLLEAATAKWLLGSTAVFEAKVKEAGDELAKAEPTKPDTEAMYAQLSQIDGEAVAIQEQINTLAQAQNDAEVALQGAENTQRMRTMLEGNLKKAQDQLALNREHKKVADEKAAANWGSDEQIEQLRRDLADAEGMTRRMTVADSLKALMATFPSEFWEGSKESFTEEVEGVERRIAATENELRAEESTANGHERNIAGLKGQIIASTNCPTCGHELKDKALIENKNAVLRNQIADEERMLAGSKREIAAYQDKLKGLREELKALKDVAKSAAPFEKFATQHGEFVDVDFTTYPPKLQWKQGDIPTRALSDPKSIKERIVSLEGAKEECGRAHARSIALAEAIESGTRSVEELQQQLDECPAAPDLNGLRQKAREVGNKVVLLKDDLAGCSTRKEAVKGQIAQAEMEYAAALARRTAAQERLKAARDDLDQLNFNNELVKKIRAARPLIADKLWSMVLTAVSTMFSQMRGEQSVVTKEKDGFKVNGKSITSLSGSTLDLLGLAIRVALVKTFLPNTGFIVLDEPAHGCDDARTSAMLGFIAASGFDQTLIVSHETATEAAADNLIAI